MENKNYWETFGLNILFVLFCPILLTYLAKESMFALFVYLLGYSLLELAIDVNKDRNNFNGIKSLIAAYIMTVAFNLGLLYGVSFIIQSTFPQVTLALFLSLVYLGLFSIIELKIENKFNRGVKK